MFAAQQLHKAYKGAPVLDGVDFTLAEHETLAIVGPSGCGKTTLLYSLCGLVPPDAGLVSLDGEPVLGPRQDISIILQDFGLLPWRTVADNVALGLKIRGLGKRERRQRAKAALADLGILGREQDYPGNLSGGEQQRVAIARAFVTDPRLLLMDEPFSSLDALTREKLQQTLLTVWTKARVPYVLVTHSLEEAAYLGRKILILSGRPAKPVACFDNPDFGDPELRRMESYFQLLRDLRQTVEASW